MSPQKLVPGEGFEPPTFGLQNRCTTTVLTRRGVTLTINLRSFHPLIPEQTPVYTPLQRSGYSSIGRAPAWHAGGQRFDSA